MSKEVFICYETETGLDYAKHLKKALEKIGRSAFVAHEDGEAGEQLREAIDKRIKACKYFGTSFYSGTVFISRRFVTSLNKNHISSIVHV